MTLLELAMGQSTYTLTDEQKLKLKMLSHAFNKEESTLSKKINPIHISLVEVPFSLYLIGQKDNSTQSFVDGYYHHFRTNKATRDSHKVFYYTLSDPYHQLSHAIYSSKLPYSIFINLKDGRYIEINRDYASLIDVQKNFSFVVGPSPSSDNPDSLDNLFSSRFASYFNKHECLILHCSAVRIDDFAVIFFGPSGAGKSTIAHTLYQKDGLKVIGSDQCYLRIIENKVVVQSTSVTIPELVNAPENSRERNPLPVKGIFYLDRSIRPHGIQQCEGHKLLNKFLKESFPYLTPFSNEQSYIEVVTKILMTNTCKFGCLSYDKEESPLRFIKSVVK